MLGRGTLGAPTPSNLDAQNCTIRPAFMPGVIGRDMLDRGWCSGVDGR